MIKLLAAGMTVGLACLSFTIANPQLAFADRACGKVKDVVPTGVEDTPALRIRARHVSCRVARALPRKVILNVRYGAINPDDYGKRALGIRKWRCKLGGYGEKTVCRASRDRRVSWWLGEVNG